MVRDEKVYEKTLNLKISAEEHRKIKLMATDKGVSIKEFIFSMIDLKYPEWRKKQ